MKALAIAFCLVSLVSCGNKSSGNSKNERDREGQCGNDSEKCSQPPLTFIEVVSSQLPEKIKLTFEIEGDSFDLVNECEPDTSMADVIRDEVRDIIFFENEGVPQIITVKITITDLGTNCDQDVVFYEQVVTPTIDSTSIAGYMGKVTYDLNN